MNKRIAVVAVGVMLVLAACGSSGGSAKATSGGGTGTGSSTTAGSGGSGSGGYTSPCSGMKAGSNGVLHTFCDGTAKATVTVGATKHVFSGGSCDTTTGVGFSVNDGVAVGPDFSGAKPNYLGLLLPEQPGALTGNPMVASFAVDGKSLALTGVTGTRTATTGSLKGTTIESPATAVTITWTC